jgi:hypothetical protein
MRVSYLRKRIAMTVTLATAFTAVLVLSATVVPASAANKLSAGTPVAGSVKPGPNAHPGPKPGPKPGPMGDKVTTTGTYKDQNCGRKPSRACTGGVGY